MSKDCIMDEEALKRNTDCVYFLASPLTCKKGINCEFRHSEAARLHPRDCWYWLGGNCSNAKCPYRHPPLDGRPASVLTSDPAPLVPSKATLVPSASMRSSWAPANKFKTPCFFFLQGYCSKGNRCLFLHGSLPSTTAQPAVEKLPEGSPGKGLDINDKPMNKVEGNGPFIEVSSSKSRAGSSTVPTLPSNVYVRAHKTPIIKNVAPPSESFRKALCANCSNVETSTVERNLNEKGRFVHRGIHTNLNMPNVADLHDRGVYKKQLQEQPKCTDEQWSMVVSSAEARQLSQAEGVSKGSRRERLSKDICDGFVEDEFGGTFDREGNRYLPHVIGGAHSPRRRECYEDAHESGLAGSEFYGIALSPDVDFDDWDERLFCQRNLSNLRRNFSPRYLARGDGYKIKDLREHLGKRRSSYQDQSSGFDGHIGVCEDHVYSDERNWVNSMESAFSENERETSWRKFRRAVRRKTQPPDHNYGWDGDGENTEISSMPPPTHLTRYCPRSKLYCNGGLYGPRRARWLSELDRCRSLQTRLRSSVNVDEGETHSGSCFSYVGRPSIKSRILSAGPDNGQVDNFEGPKPLNVLLQEKRKVN